MQLSKGEKLKILIIMIFFVTAIGTFIADAYVPALPLLAHALHFTHAQAKLTLSGYLLSLAIAQLLCGPLSDQYGRYRLIFGGLVICIIGTIICILAKDFTFFMLGRILQGIGASATGSLFRAIVRDIWSGAELKKVISVISTVFSIIPAVAPLIGGYLSVLFGWKAIFIFILIYTMISLLLIKLYLPETNLRLNPKAFHSSQLFINYWRLLINPTFFGYTFCSMMVMAGFFAYMAASPFLLQNIMGYSQIEYSWSIVWLISMSISSRIINIKLIDYFSSQQIIKIGLSSMLLAGIVMLIMSYFKLSPFIMLILPSMLYVFATGFVFAHAFSNSMEAFPEIAGAASALYSSLLMGGSFFGTIVVTWVHMTTTRPLAIIFVIFAIATWLVFWRFILRVQK